MPKQDVIEYVADMASQLANLGREYLPLLARVLDLAAEMAREALQRAR